MTATLNAKDFDTVFNEDGQAVTPVVDEVELFMPTWDNKPPDKPSVLTVGGGNILTFQNITAIIAKQGSGKTSVCEAITSAVINADADNLGVTANVNSLLRIDFELTQNDIWNSWYRTMRRAKVERGENLDAVTVVSFRNISTAQERKKRIETLLSQRHYELILMDGVGDLVDDTNSLEQAIQLKNWLRYITSHYNTSILTTLHPNKNSNTPRGHIGSEILREAENVLLIEVDADGNRLLTTDFEHGKARNGGHVQTAFKWNDEVKMFTTIDYVAKERIVKQAPQDKMEHAELLELVKQTSLYRASKNDTIEAIGRYIKHHVSYVKTNDKIIREFVVYLVDNNYLIETKDEQDKRKIWYQYNHLKE
jgi:hypothetical protein